MGLLNDVGRAAGSAISSAVDVLDKIVDNNNNQQRNFEKDGFIVPPIPSASGDGLPSSRVKAQRPHKQKRHIIHWFVPEVGAINMYVNPQRIDYGYKKVINTERTKGGYIMQYWGEELPTLSISGTTGSSGFEGINVLYEIYRSEQINFDPIGLTIASDSTVSGLGEFFGNAIGGGGLLGAATNGLLGGNPLTNSILPRNPPTLASLAFSVEMYYQGMVYRGYFQSMNIKESVERMGMMDYDMQFIVTQQRGYRVNNFDFQRSANHGPSDNSEGGIPLSYGTGLSFGR